MFIMYVMCLAFLCLYQFSGILSTCCVENRYRDNVIIIIVSAV